MALLSEQLADWAVSLRPTDDDYALGQRALVDTVAVAVAAKEHPLVGKLASLGQAGRWAATAHVLDFDDLHIESTTHISTVIVPVVASCGGSLRDYLAGAGVMARLGSALGWRHYERGWHATCTAGAPGAAVAAAMAMGLDAHQIAHALVLAIPAAGGVQRAFGTDGKSLQVGYAADAGIRAARLARQGARGKLEALDAWLAMVDAEETDVEFDGPAVPGGLAIKLHPCCYAMQRIIAAVREAIGEAPVDVQSVEQVVLRTPAASLHPLIHHSPWTGLEGKFSAEYAIAAPLLEPFPGFESFSDAAVRRSEARRLMERVSIAEIAGGDGLLAGAAELEIWLAGGERRRASVSAPPGAPERPPTASDLGRKADACGVGLGRRLHDIDVAGAAELLRSELVPGRPVAELAR